MSGNVSVVVGKRVFADSGSTWRVHHIVVYSAACFLSANVGFFSFSIFIRWFQRDGNGSKANLFCSSHGKLLLVSRLMCTDI